MKMKFGPSYFQEIPKYGVGLGLNPSDAHDDYIKEINKLVDYVEITAASSRDQGPVNYTEKRRKQIQKNGFHHWSLRDYPNDVRKIIHSTNVNPVYPETISVQAYNELRKLAEDTNSPWITEDLGIWLMSERHTYPYFLPLPLTKQTLAITIRNVLEFQEKVGVPFNAEFPPIRVIAGDMHAFDFFRILVEETGCGMCIDIGHVLSYQLERGVSPTADLHLLPWDSVTELHVAGGNIDLASDGLHYDDNHGDYDIVSVCYDMMDTATLLAPNLKAITLEVFGSQQPSLTIKKIKDIRSRKSIINWMKGVKEDSGIDIPSFEGAKEHVNKSVIAMYDLLHNTEPVTGKTLFEGGIELLDIFANSQQRLWDYERISRLQIQGLNLSSYFPLTSKWIIRNGVFDDEVSLYAYLLKDLPGSTVSMWDKVVQVYEKLVDELVPNDIIARQLYKCEKWMNECAMDENSAKETMNFPIDIFTIIGKVNKNDEIDLKLLKATNITMTHLGECKFGKVSNDLEFDEPVPTGVRGKSECCTGK
jgi:uncharacterized protein (UPF0276 family)